MKEKLFTEDDLLFFGEKVIAWEKSKENYNLEDLVINYINPNKYPLKGQEEYQKKYDVEFTEFCEKD